MLLKGSDVMNDTFSLIEETSSEETVSAYIFDDGEIIDASQIQKGASTTPKPNSVGIDEDEFGEQYSSGRVYRPTLHFKNMKEFSMENPFHLRCINQKSVDACSGWDITNIDRRGVALSTENKKKTIKDNKLYDFFDNCTLFDNFTELSKQIVVDYETYSFATVEVLRNKKGDPAKLLHIPAESCRLSRKLIVPGYDRDTDLKFMLQVVNRHERVYKIFDEDGVAGLIEPNTKNQMSEILFIRGYHVNGGKYGIPGWVTSLKSMVGYDKVAQYNINFFNNEAVPRFAVIVQGGKLDTEEKNLIRNYFKNDLKGVENAHKTLVLTTGKGAQVKLVPLATEIKDGSFRFYRKDNRDEIISSHGVPPHRIQVYDSGNAGTLSPTSLFNIDKAYKYSMIVPLQQKLTSMFNSIIKTGFGIKGKSLVYNDLDIDEEKQKAEIMKTVASAHEKYYNIGVMTIDEVRDDLKLITYNDDPNMTKDVKEWAKTPKPIFLIQRALLNPEATIGNDGTTNLKQTTNEFNDKSKEQTGIDNQDASNLMMKSTIE